MAAVDRSDRSEANPATGSEPRLLRVRANGIELAVFEWHPELRGIEPSYVFTHATGFHARCWDPVIHRLPPRHVLAVDQRGHGRSQKAEFENWAEFGRDLGALLRELGVRGAIGVGHSMGGHATVDAAAHDALLFRRLVLVDPVILSPELYSADEAALMGEGQAGNEGHEDGRGQGRERERDKIDLDAANTVEHPTVRRRNAFASPREMIERFERREPFSLFVPEALRAYCEHGLLPASDRDADGGENSERGHGMVLACPPAVEARVYATVRSNPGIHESVRRLTIPVRVIRSMQPRTPADLLNFQYSPTWPGLADAFAKGSDVCRPDRTHFLPMQDPDWIAAQLQI